MKQFLRILVCLSLIATLLLSGCAGHDDPQGMPEDAQSDRNTEAEDSATKENERRIALDATVAIFDAPSYDGSYVQIVGEDGTYTLTGETEDAEGNHWGRLASGLGWVDLTALEETRHVPVTACYAEESLMHHCDCMEYRIDDSEYMVRVAFRAAETLRDVQFLAVQPFGVDAEAEMLCALDTVEAGMALVFGVAFYGDMTAYALSFTDASGAARYFELTVSGRNGALVLQEYERTDPA